MRRFIRAEDDRCLCGTEWSRSARAWCGTRAGQMLKADDDVYLHYLKIGCWTKAEQTGAEAHRFLCILLGQVEV